MILTPVFILNQTMSKVYLHALPDELSDFIRDNPHYHTLDDLHVYEVLCGYRVFYGQTERYIAQQYTNSIGIGSYLYLDRYACGDTPMYFCFPIDDYREKPTCSEQGAYADTSKGTMYSFRDIKMRICSRLQAMTNFQLPTPDLITLKDAEIARLFCNVAFDYQDWESVLEYMRRRNTYPFNLIERR